MSELIEKLEKIKEIVHMDDQNAAKIAGWERSHKKASLIVGLAEHDGVRFVIDEMEKYLAEVSDELSADEKILEVGSDDEIKSYVERRKILIVERKVINRFLDIFKFAKDNKDGVEREVEANLKNLEEENA